MLEREELCLCESPPPKILDAPRDRSGPKLRPKMLAARGVLEWCLLSAPESETPERECERCFEEELCLRWELCPWVEELMTELPSNQPIFADSGGLERERCISSIGGRLGICN